MMLSGFGEIFLAVGPLFVIGTGIAGTVLFASRWNGIEKWLLLVLSPVVIFALIFFLTKFASDVAVEGSGFLLGGATIGLFLLATLFVYYPILAIAGIRSFILHRRAQNNRPSAIKYESH